MSAPDGDLERQARHHRGPLRGMFAVVLFALVLLAILGFWAFGRGGDPEGADSQVQSGLGTEAEADPVSANDFAAEEAGAEPSDAAVTVEPEAQLPSETPADAPADTDPGESQQATPADGDAAETDAAADSATDGAADQ
jgi:hypothetical protein